MQDQPSRQIIEVLHLDEVTRQALERPLSTLPSPFEDFPTFACEAMRYPMIVLPQALLSAVGTFSRHPAAPAAVYVKNGPHDPHLPETPIDGGRAQGKQTFISEAWAVVLASFCGQPFGYHHEKQGEMIHNIVPVRGRETAMSNESSTSTFDWHVDNAGQRPKPDVFVLVCVRSDRRGEAQTLVIDARTILEHVDQASVTALRAPEFLFRTPESFRANMGVEWSAPQPVISGPPELPEIELNMYNVKGKTRRAERALAAVAEVVDTPGLYQGIALQPGEALLIDNRKAMHGRTPFEPAYDGTDRWVQRVYAHSNLWPYRSRPDASAWLY